MDEDVTGAIENAQGLAALLRNSTEAQDLAMALLLPFHDALLSLAGTLGWSIAIIGLTVALVKTIVEPFYKAPAVFVQIIAVAMLLIPTTVTVTDFSTAIEGGPIDTTGPVTINSAIGEHLPAPDQGFQVSYALYLLLRVTSLFEQMIMDGLDAAMDYTTGTSGNEGALMMNALGTRLQTTMSDPDLNTVLTAYGENCGNAVIRRNGLTQNEMRGIGLVGGYSALGYNLATGNSGGYTLPYFASFFDIGDDSSQNARNRLSSDEIDRIKTELRAIHSARSESMALYEGFYGIGFRVPSASMLTSVRIGPLTAAKVEEYGGVGAASEGYMTRWGDYNNEDFRYPLLRPGNEAALQARIESTGNGPGPNPSVAHFVTQTNWYVTDCYQMYLLADLAARQQRIASLLTYLGQQTLSDEEMAARFEEEEEEDLDSDEEVINIKTSLALATLSGASSYAASVGNSRGLTINQLPNDNIREQQSIWENALKNEAYGGMTWFIQFYEEFKLDLYVYFAIGFAALLVALMFVIAPIVFMFSVIPGRGDSSIKLLLGIFWIKCTLLLMYFFLRVGDFFVAITGRQMMISAMSDAGGSVFLASLVLVSGIGTLIGVMVVSPALSYMLVFSETRGLGLGARDITNKMTAVLAGGGFQLVRNQKVQQTIGKAGAGARSVAGRGVSHAVGVGVMRAAGNHAFPTKKGTAKDILSGKGRQPDMSSGANSGGLPARDGKGAAKDVTSDSSNARSPQDRSRVGKDATAGTQPGRSGSPIATGSTTKPDNDGQTAGKDSPSKPRKPESDEQE